MLSHCLKCRKHAESESPIVVKTKKKRKEEESYLQNVFCVNVKNQDLSKNKKLAD